MKNIMFIGDTDCFNYLPRLKEILPACKFLTKLSVRSLGEVSLSAMKYKSARGENIDAVVTNSPEFLKLFIRENFDIQKINAASINNYEGSVFFMSVNNRTVPLLVIPPLKQLITVPYGKFLFQRFFAKIFENELIRPVPKLLWEKVAPETVAEVEKYAKLFEGASLISVDIETTQVVAGENEKHFKERMAEHFPNVKTDGFGYMGNMRTDAGGKSKKVAFLVPSITMVGFTGIFIKDNKLESFTIVVDMYSSCGKELIKRICENPVKKTMQRGQYDCQYLLRYGIAPYNYVFDTYNMMHAWYAELPKSLEFIAAFMIRNFQYWKDESGGDTFHYCAKDCHVTAWATFFLLLDMPDWAKVNFTKSFPKKFPNLTCALDGLQIDQTELKEKRKYTVALIEKLQVELEMMTVPNFNPRSPKQVLALMHALLFKQAKKTDKITMEKFRNTHPLYSRIADQIQSLRKNTKALSNYIDFTQFAGRLLYEIDECGTETSRFASKASGFWCGTQIQNIPPYAKSMFITDKGFKLGAIDNSQSESRTTAYLTGDENLIDTVETAKDFHTRNVALFFGFVEDELWRMKKEDEATYKALRNTGKRVNHGANYNMMEYVLLQTMGEKAVIHAKYLLNLPPFLTLLGVCRYLLNAFDKAYPKVRGEFQEKIIEEVESTGLLRTPVGWTRRCFGQIRDNKPVLNSYVAHKPQCMSVQMINESYYKSWLKLQIHENLIRMKAQIHDENFFAYRLEKEEYIYNTISDYMKEPVETEHGTLVIPNDWAKGGEKWADLKE